METSQKGFHTSCMYCLRATDVCKQLMSASGPKHILFVIRINSLPIQLSESILITGVYCQCTTLTRSKSNIFSCHWHSMWAVVIELGIESIPSSRFPIFRCAKLGPLVTRSGIISSPPSLNIVLFYSTRALHLPVGPITAMIVYILHVLAWEA